MIATFIFVTCLLLIISVFPMSMKSLAKGQIIMQADQVAQQELEYLRNMDWEDLSDFETLAQSDPDLFYRNTTLTTQTNGVTKNMIFQSTPYVTVVSTDTTGAPTVLDVRVIVRYGEGSSAIYDNSVELETLVARPY